MAAGGSKGEKQRYCYKFSSATRYSLSYMGICKQELNSGGVGQRDSACVSVIENQLKNGA